MALQELVGFPFLVSGPQTVEGETLGAAAWGWHGTDALPTGAEWLCNADLAPEGHVAAIVLMDAPEPPDDLPPGWWAEAYDLDDTWASDDGVWIVKAMHQQADGAWIFAGYCR